MSSNPLESANSLTDFVKNICGVEGDTPTYAYWGVCGYCGCECTNEADYPYSRCDNSYCSATVKFKHSKNCTCNKCKESI